MILDLRPARVLLTTATIISIMLIAAYLLPSLLLTNSSRYSHVSEGGATPYISLVGYLSYSDADQNIRNPVGSIPRVDYSVRNRSHVTFVITHLKVDFHPTLPIREICLEELSVLHWTFVSPEGWSEFRDIKLEMKRIYDDIPGPTCVDHPTFPDRSERRGGYVLVYVNERLIIGDIYKDWMYPEYPFDEIQLKIRLMSRVVMHYEDGSTIVVHGPVGIIAGSGSSLWETSVAPFRFIDMKDDLPENPEISDDEWGVYASDTAVSLSRPKFVRVLTILLLSTLLLITASVLLVKQVSLAIELSVGLLVGVWGVRQIIIPNDVQGVTAVELMLIGIFIIIAGAFVLLVIKEVWLNLSIPSSSSSINAVTTVGRQTHNGKAAPGHSVLGIILISAILVVRLYRARHR